MKNLYDRFGQRLKSYDINPNDETVSIDVYFRVFCEELEKYCEELNTKKTRRSKKKSEMVADGQNTDQA